MVTGEGAVAEAEPEVEGEADPGGHGDVDLAYRAGEASLEREGGAAADAEPAPIRVDGEERDARGVGQGSADFEGEQAGGVGSDDPARSWPYTDVSK